MRVSAAAVRSAWVRGWSELFLAGLDWGMTHNKLVSNKQVYQMEQ
jgi:hypothetical protein